MSKNRTFLISIALVIALVGCSPTSQAASTPVPPTTQPSLPPLQQEIQINQPQIRKIAVIGEGEVSVTPDYVKFTVGIETESSILETAKKENDKIAVKVMEVIQQYGINEKDYQTSYLGIYPDRDYRTSSVTGYNVYNSIQLTIRDLTQFEAILMDILHAGANRISGVQFQVTDEETYKAQARELAMKDARDKAAAMAGVLGQEIGMPLTIQEVVLTSSGKYLNLLTDAVILSSSYIDSLTTIAIGETSIKATVTVEFELK